VIDILAKSASSPIVSDHLPIVVDIEVFQPDDD